MTNLTTTQAYGGKRPASTVSFIKATDSINFRDYGIGEDALLFVKTDEPYREGKLSMFKNDTSYSLMSDKQSGYEYVGAIDSVINYYF